jgi:hypothetical protein
MPVVDYLASIGLRKEEDGSISGLNTFPLIVDYGDGTAPVARAVFAMTPEGYAVCGGNIPPGSILSIGHFDTTEILDTTEQTVKTALQTGNHNAALIYSCVGRFYAQGLDHEGEMNRIVKCMRESGVPYLASYSGGELCPVYNSDDKTINRNHNNSIIICMI